MEDEHRSPHQYYQWASVDSGLQLVKRVVQPDVGDGEFVKCQLLGYSSLEHQPASSFGQFFVSFASSQQLEVHQWYLLIRM